jgi:hypothetical protein
MCASERGIACGAQGARENDANSLPATIFGAGSRRYLAGRKLRREGGDEPAAKIGLARPAILPDSGIIQIVMRTSTAL